MLACETLVATLVVARDAGHELLRVRLVTGLDLGEKVYGIAGPECGGHTSEVQDLHVPVLSGSTGETKVRPRVLMVLRHGRVGSVRAASRSSKTSSLFSSTAPVGTQPRCR